MQPYFAPYAGYFRLLAAADLLVLFDCVQFPRRGWVHRNRLPDRDGVLRWATVPLARAGFDAAIRDVRIADGAADEIAAWRRRFPALAGAHPLADALGHPSGPLVDYVERLLAGAAAELRLPWRTLRSSALAIDPALRGQDRVLAILRTLGAGAYVNPPGGRALYDAAAFADAGMTLRFLDDWQGCSASILHRLAVEPAAELAAEIRRQA